ncbi:MAG TPA: hypothetical protein VN018_00515 [Brevundimonas sp.]|nr:hypothetical protein [Brevundimonas sp.]
MMAREDLPLEGGPGMIVRCTTGDCTHAAILDPRALFGARHLWPADGVTNRFRCVCGGRQATIDYPARTVDRYGPIDRASLALWY